MSNVLAINKASAEAVERQDLEVMREEFTAFVKTDPEVRAILLERSKEAIANYMHHELFEITGDTQMLPWLRGQGEMFMEMIDRGVEHVKKHPLAAQVKEARKP